MSRLWLPKQNRLPKDHLDADEIVYHLWQGSLPPQGGTVGRSGFKYLVLSAWESQPPSRRFPGVRVLKVALEDALRPPTKGERQAMFAAGNWVAGNMDKGSVLVTCHAGLNRSGILSAMALIIRGDNPRAAVAMVQAARPGALRNRYFVDYLLSLGG